MYEKIYPVYDSEQHKIQERRDAKVSYPPELSANIESNSLLVCYIIYLREYGYKKLYPPNSFLTLDFLSVRRNHADIRALKTHSQI